MNCAKSRLCEVLVVLLASTVWLPGFASLPVFDRDEARFAQASRQMFESTWLPVEDRDEFHSGGWIVPQIQDRPRLAKPPLIYWLQVGSAALATGGDPSADEIWMYRAPSLLMAAVLLMLTARLGTAMYGGWVGTTAALMLGLSPIVAWEVRQARIDLVLTSLVVAAQYCLWKHVTTERPSSRCALGFWTLVGLGVLAKGPVALLVCLSTVLTLAVDRSTRPRLRALHPILGSAIISVLVLPWIAAAAGRSDSLSKVASHEIIRRFFEPLESHGGPPGFHLLLLGLLLWPGSLFLIPAAARLISRIRNGKLRHSSLATKFLLSWIVPTWLVFELSQTKLPHYTLPLFPAITIGLAATASSRLESRRLVARLGISTWWAVCLVLLVVPASTLAELAGLRWLAMTLAVFGIVISALVARELNRGSARRAVAVAAGGWMVILPAILGLLPRWQDPWISERVLAAVHRVDPELERPLGAFGYQEDSLIYLSRGRWTRIGEAELTTWFDDHPHGLMLLPATSVSSRMLILESVRGLWYSKGQWAELVVAEQRQTYQPVSTSSSRQDSPVTE